MSNNETTHDSSDSLEDQLTEISEFQQKIRLLRWGMVTGTLLIIAIGVINIVGKVQKVAEPVVKLVKDVQEIRETLPDAALSVQEIYEGGDRFYSI
jgi:hypothetical protein